MFSNIIYEKERRISRLMISRDCSSTVYGQVMSLFLLFILKASIIHTFTGTCIYSWLVSAYLICKGIESDKARVCPSKKQKRITGRIRRSKKADARFGNLLQT